MKVYTLKRTTVERVAADTEEEARHRLYWDLGYPSADEFELVDVEDIK